MKDSPPADSKSSEKFGRQDKGSSSTTIDEKTHSVNFDQDDELTSAVNPMRSDFHFFAMDHKEEAIDYVKKEEAKTDTSPFKIITDLNERLLKMWEGTSPRVRTVYMQKEESDRYRFMSEDEIASRNCATLTSRTSTRKSTHNAVANVVTKDEEDDSHDKSGTKRQTVNDSTDGVNKSSEYESPTKKIKEDSQEKEPVEKGEKEKEPEKKEEVMTPTEGETSKEPVQKIKADEKDSKTITKDDSPELECEKKQ